MATHSQRPTPTYCSGRKGPEPAQEEDSDEELDLQCCPIVAGMTQAELHALLNRFEASEDFHAVLSEMFSPQTRSGEVGMTLRE